MHRIDTAYATVANLFTEGNPAVGEPATRISDDWLNDLQEELCNVIESAGITLAKGTRTQLLSALTRLTSERVSVKKYGAVAGAESTAAIQAAINDLTSGQTLDLCGSTYYINNTLTIPTSGVRIVNGKLIAAAGANFEYMLFGTGLTDVVIKGVHFDANKANRTAGQNIRFMCAGFALSTDCGFINCTARNARGYGGISAVGLVLSGCVRGFAKNAILIDCGDSGFDADGIFTSGTQNLIANCRAFNCTDTAFVIENSSFSMIAACQSYGCAAGGAVTVAGNDDRRGNAIDGLNIYNWDAPSTGAIQIGTLSGTGNLYDTTLSGVTMSADTGSGYGSGAAIWVRKVGTGKAIGVDLGTLNINGASYGVRVDDGDNVCIASGSIIKGVTSASAYFAGGVDHSVKASHLQGGDYGVLVANAAEVDVFGNTFKGQSVAAIAALNTSVANNFINTFKSLSGVRVSKDAGATVNSMGTLNAQPVLSSNILTNGVAGTLVKKIEIYDQNAVSQGFLYLHNT